jgi:hypothetical protein
VKVTALFLRQRRDILSLLSSKRLSRLAVSFVLVTCSLQVQGAGITVGNGASFKVGSGTINLNCLDFTMAGLSALGDGMVTGAAHVGIESSGQLNGDTGSIFLSGDWLNAGAFTPAQGSINVRDGCSFNESLIIGDNDFYRFSALSSSGKTLAVEAGSVQAFANTLSLQGLDSQQRLKIRSSLAGQPAFFTLSPQGAQDIYAVDVQDNDASGGQKLAPGIPADFDSLNSGNNKNWFELLADLIFSDSFEGD